MLKALLYRQAVLGGKKGKTRIKGLLLPQNNEEINIERYLKNNNNVETIDVLFVKNVNIPIKAPYSLTFQRLLDIISSTEDRNQ